MQRIKLIVLASFVALAVGLAALPVAVHASSSSEPAASVYVQGKGPGGKGNNGNGKGQNGKGADKKQKDDKGNNGNGNQANNNDAAGGPGRGLGGWLRAFRARWFGEVAGQDFGGWQLGRFKDVFPFAYPQGWKAQERGDALVLSGAWEGQDYLFQMTRSARVGYDSLRDWVASETSRLGVSEGDTRFVDAGRTQIAVVTGVDDAGYDCPVAYVYLWTQNPAGNNQRQAMGVISQTPGASCDTVSLNAFIDAYLARVGEGQRPLPLVTPTAPSTPVLSPTPAPTATRTAASGWQQTRFFNAFSFAYPDGWSMDRLGDTAHLQGQYQNRSYVMDVVWVRATPQNGLEPWVKADLTDLGVSPERAQIDYVRQGGAQFAVVSGVSMPGYDCPIVRVYVIADNPAGDGPRAFVATLAQANGQACDPQALTGMAFQMLRQA